jgi:4-amino-4-deoxy-L-arabinose transferase-like glycosyltransferase
MPPSARSSAARLALLLLVATVSIGAGLGRASLWEPDEPRFAEATRQMFARGDFLTPYFNGVPRFEKPILLYWLQAVSFVVIGPGELAARLPSALAGIGCVLLLYLLASRLASARAALLAALVLATMFRFVTLSRQGLTDVPTLFFMMATLYGFVCATTPPFSRGAVWGAWLAIGLGILTKAAVGVLPLVIWLSYAAIRRRVDLVTKIRPVAGLALATAVAAPWYVAMVVLHGRPFLEFAIGHEMVARVLSEQSFAPPRGFFYYFRIWPGDAAPWSVVFVAALAWFATRWRRLDTDVRQTVIFAAAWFAAVFFVFSLSRSKVPHYVLPAYPAAALAIGVFIDRVADATRESLWWRVPMTAVASVLLVTAAVLVWSLDVLMPDTGVLTRSLLPGVLAIGAVMVALAIRRTAAVHATIALALTLCGSFAVIGSIIIPVAIEGFKPMPRLARAAETVAAPNAPIGLMGRYGASSLIYYSHHNVSFIDDDEAAVRFLTGNPNALCVMPESEHARLSSRLPSAIRKVDSAEEFNVRFERLLDRQRTPGRQWVLIESGGTR